MSSLCVLVETIDFMTARWARLPYEFIENVSNRIINEIEAVSRVAFTIYPANLLLLSSGNKIKSKNQKIFLIIRASCSIYVWITSDYAINNLCQMKKVEANE